MAEVKVDLQETIEKAFLDYAGYVALRRALPDARDGLKHGARQGLYCQFVEGLTHDKPYKKALKSVAAGTSRAYVHGDVSLYDTLIRMGKPFAFRYPLQDVQGSYGTPIKSDNHAHARYVEMRQAELASYLFEGLKKNAVEKWYWNYDDTEQIPSVLPSPFFYNIVNGATGIGVGMASSIPTFNLREVNKALAILVLNPEASFEEIYCPIDFPTGATIINEEQVKESLRVGRGKSAIIRATLNYDARKHQIVVTEIPYMVYTETICSEIGKLLEEDPSIGIERVLDATTDVPRIEISLSKKVDAETMKKWLYANTSLQSYYQINMTMLDMGKKPRVFGWREALLAHISHMREVKRREYEFELDKAKNRLHILEGLLIAIEHIDEFIALIKASESSGDATRTMRERYGVSELQAKAILDIRLARLAKLEYVKVKNEVKEVTFTIDNITDLLTNQERFDKMLVDGLNDVAKRFGDARRTTNINISKELEEKKVEIIHEEANIVATITSNGSLYMNFASDATKKNVRQTLDPKNYVIDSVYGSRTQSLLVFTKSGLAHTIDLNKLEVNKTYNLYDMLEMVSSDYVVAVLHSDNCNNAPYLICATRNGMIKKTAIKEFFGKKKGGLELIKLKEGDELACLRLVKNETDNILLLTAEGYVIKFAQAEVSATGRMTQGVKGASLRASDRVVDMLVAAESDDHLYLLTISNNGSLKKTAISDFSLTARNAKGTIGHKPAAGDQIALGTISAGTKAIRIGAANTSTQIANNKFELSDRGKAGKNPIIIQDGATINYLAEVD